MESERMPVTEMEAEEAAAAQMEAAAAKEMAA